MTEIEPLEEIVYLIRNFADGLHYAKEESLLFPKTVGKGFSTSQGPVAVMLSDHVQGREFVRQIAEGIALARKGEAGAWEQIWQGMTGYTGLLRNHIAKENNVLFRMADNMMDQEKHIRLLAEFRKVDQGAGGETLDNYISRIYAMVKALNVP